MKAMVFAAGLGTRLRPLTNDRPKALVEVGGVAMLERVLVKLHDAGVTDVVVNVHHFAPKVKSFLEANGWFGMNGHVSDESGLLLETGGGILKARDLLDGDEPFIVHNADILTDFDLGSMMESHTSSGADVTLLVDRRDSSRRLLFDSGMRMKGWKNMLTGQLRPASVIDDSGLEALAFGGVHVITPQPFFERLTEFGAGQCAFSITPFYIESCDNLDIRGYIPAEEYGWIDIGRPESLRRAEDYVREK